MGDNYVIEVDKVSCKSGYKYLIKDISWKVKSGEHWVVFGMNGSGKTTLLSIIAGFKHYTSGDVRPHPPGLPPHPGSSQRKA